MGGFASSQVQGLKVAGVPSERVPHYAPTFRSIPTKFLGEDSADLRPSVLCL